MQNAGWALGRFGALDPECSEQPVQGERAPNNSEDLMEVGRRHGSLPRVEIVAHPKFMEDYAIAHANRKLRGISFKFKRTGSSCNLGTKKGAPKRALSCGQLTVTESACLSHCLRLRAG